MIWQKIWNSCFRIILISWSLMLESALDWLDVLTAYQDFMNRLHSIGSLRSSLSLIRWKFYPLWYCANDLSPSQSSGYICFVNLILVYEILCWWHSSWGFLFTQFTFDKCTMMSLFRLLSFDLWNFVFRQVINDEKKHVKIFFFFRSTKGRKAIVSFSFCLHVPIRRTFFFLHNIRIGQRT